MNKPTVFALGAYDRFNYGDILFPIISKNFLAEHYPDIRFECYALQASDFSAYGSLVTKPIRELSRRSVVNDGDSIFFCGGGTLGSDWYNMHANMLGNAGNYLLYYFRRIFGEAAANNLSRSYFGAHSQFPWIAEPNDFPAQVNVIYNAVGGSEIGHMSDATRALALNKLAKGRYVSFRDQETKDLCAPIQAQIDLHVAPDSAVLMSEQYPISKLESLINPQLRTQIAGENYVCFHANYNFVKQNIDEITGQLELIYQQHGLKTVLLPIGRYVGLDDQIGLGNLKAKLSTPCELISDEASIWDIMYTIANARLFIGTSLHGNVTSQSFAVPHIGLSSRRSKLDFYLDTWDLDEHKICPKLSDINLNATQALQVPEPVRQNKRSQLIELATQNMHRIAAAILN